MEYRVEELAAAAGIRVDTVRFYQAKGLLPPPRRVKRAALYSRQHLTVIERIRRYQEQGLTLAVIKRLLTAGPRSTVDALLTAVADRSGPRSLTRAQLARDSGVPEPLLASLEAAGLLRPVEIDGKSRYGETDLQMARAGLDVLKQEFPLHELIQLAIIHDRAVRENVDTAIELFDRYVRKSGSEAASPERVAAAFRDLLPAVTTLVALHFERTLLRRALDLLRERGEHEALEVAKQVVGTGRLNFEVAWR
jgi:DNA-binding transcriptional MerR regulator